MNLRDMPIKRKVTLVILVTCWLVLLLACAVLTTYQIVRFRRTTVRDTTVLADVLARNTQAALSFQDENAAEETLRALAAEPNVEAACLYSRDGTVFAGYSRLKGAIEYPKSPPTDGDHFDPHYLIVVRPVVLHEKRVGTILLQSDLHGIYDRVKLFSIVAALVLLGACGVALALATPLQRTISGPIMALTDMVRVMAEHKDYTVRMPAQGRDETGQLAAAFNQLLASLEERDKALRAANELLSQQLARLGLLNQITRATSERLDLPSVFQVVVRTLEDQLPLDFCCICVHDSAAKTIALASVGVRNEQLAAALAANKADPLSINVSDHLARCAGGQVVCEPDISAASDDFSKRLAEAGLRSFLAAPLVIETTIFGVLLAARSQTNSFGDGECEFLRQLGEHVALAARQAQLHSALQQAYDDLRQSQQTILQQERLRALGQMASGIAHDINNAISPVALYTESLLETEPALSPRARDYLETIQRSIEDVAQTLARMREFYRQRESPMPPQPVQINPLIQQVANLSRARWSDMPQQKGIQIEMVAELATDLPVIAGVESEIREALLNLVFNAVDAMPEGGKLTMRTIVVRRPVPSGKGSVACAAVEVSDTGMGMDEETRRRCLEPFFTTKGERGTGLGLAMVYGIVQRHGADIEIESQKGRGTTVRLVFSPSAVSAPPAQAASPLAPVARLRILIVDDDPLLIKSLRDTLEMDGHFVQATNGGQAGIDAFQAAQKSKEPFSVVITDLGMPYVDGRKVASAVKTASPATPVILLTGWGQRLMAEGGIPPNVDQVLNKPPKLHDLRNALASGQPRGIL